MSLLMALLRSAYLAFLIGYTLVVSPLGALWGGPAGEPGAGVPVAVVEKVFVAAWLAIGWIALEAVVAWVQVWLDTRARRQLAAAAAPPAGERPAGPKPAP